MKSRFNTQYRVLAIAVTAASLTLGGHAAWGLSFKFDKQDMELDVDTIVSYAAQWRVASRDESKIGYVP